MKRLLFVLVPALFLIAAAAPQRPALAQDSAFLAVAQDPTLGAILTDANGMTVYLFTQDTEAGEGACDEQCAMNFPPVPSTDIMTLPDGVPGALASFDRTDGTKQASYNGIPLYYFAGDSQPGDVNGQAVGGIWFVVPPGAVLGPYPAPVGQGTPVPAAALLVGFTTDVGPFLTDSAGLTLYIFQQDIPGMSACSGDCATIWPPFAPSDALTLPIGVAGTLVTITRDDGTQQVTYNDQPLYTFQQDAKPGDVTGQNLNNFVVAGLAAAPATSNGTPDAGSSGTTQNADAAVEIAGFAFSPDTLQVAAGTTVTWTNNDSTTHTVTADDGSFDAGNVDPDSSFSFTFDSPGTYSYHCNIHPSMTATIVVS